MPKFIMLTNVLYSGRPLKKGDACPEELAQELVKSGLAALYQEPKPPTVSAPVQPGPHVPAKAEPVKPKGKE